MDLVFRGARLADGTGDPIVRRDVGVAGGRGTFPRYLSRYVRQLGVLDRAECVDHLTGRAARRLRLTDRGLVREGYGADLVLFDPETVHDTATFDDPRQQAAGIPYVFVNGVAAIDDGRPTGALAGRSLMRRRKT
jgi:N-acyl-D-amino-acid deacylase